jgi:hypothetical protein
VADVAVSVVTTARAPLDVTFDTIVPIDLTRIFRGYAGVLPAVVGVRDQSGLWDTAGATRVVLLGDGSEAPERLTAVTPHSGFAYVVGPFTGVLGRVVDHAVGEWRFADDGAGGTRIAWTYTFVPRPGRTALVRLIAPVWRRYAARALALAAAAAEADAAR